MAETKRDAPIPAENVDEARPWRLPFWTEPPAYAVEREQEDAAAENTEANADEDESPGYPTAEELELIRREAYNDGLEQGRVEGRQLGIQEGRTEGHAEGHQAGYDEGIVEGRKDGTQAGYNDGRAQGKAEIDAEVQRLRTLTATLQAALTERDAQLPEVMVMLVTRVTEQVLGHELKTGAQSIQQYVHKAIASLPDGEEVARIVVSPDDAALLSDAVLPVQLKTDPRLQAGECRVESDNSLVEYSVGDHLQQTLLALAEQMLTEGDGFPSESEVRTSEITPPAADANETDANETSSDSATVSPQDSTSAEEESADVEETDVSADGSKVTGGPQDEPESPLE